MIYSFAPLEGITGYIFRNAHHKVFPEIDEYYIPFAAPNMHHSFSPKELRDVDPKHNEGMHAVPQLLTNRPDYFIKAAQELYAMGYREVNLNIGCPSQTVCTKGKGAGMLRDTIALDAFFHEVFRQWNFDMKISVKTRLGIAGEAEFDEVLEVLNTYPLDSVILHPRVQKDFYKNPVRPAMFRKAAEECQHPLVYNGDLHSPSDCNAIEAEYPALRGIMLGRGLLENPGLVTTLKTGRVVTASEIRRFHDIYYTDYAAFASGDKQILSKMKELWVFLCKSFPESEKHMKQIKKCSRTDDYERIIDSLFRDLEFRPK